MLRISTKGGYGIRLCTNWQWSHGQGPVPLKVVAEKQALSEHYLEQLMGTLRKAGLVKGPGELRGYQLAPRLPRRSV